MTKEQIKRANQIVSEVSEYQEKLKSLSKATMKTVSIGDRYKTLISFSVKDSSATMKPLLESVMSTVVNHIKDRIEKLEKELQEM